MAPEVILDPKVLESPEEAPEVQNLEDVASESPPEEAAEAPRTPEPEVTPEEPEPQQELEVAPEVALNSPEAPEEILEASESPEDSIEAVPTPEEHPEPPQQAALTSPPEATTAMEDVPTVQLENLQVSQSAMQNNENGAEKASDAPPPAQKTPVRSGLRKPQAVLRTPVAAVRLVVLQLQMTCLT